MLPGSSVGQLCNLHIRLKVQKPEDDSSVSGLTWDANCPGLGPYSQSPKGAEWVLLIGWKVNSVDPPRCEDEVAPAWPEEGDSDPLAIQVLTILVGVHPHYHQYLQIIHVFSGITY